MDGPIPARSATADGPRDSLAGALDRTLLASLGPVCTGLAALYAVFALAHLAVVPPPNATILAACAGLTGLALAAIRHRLGRGAVPPRRSHAVGALIAALVLANSLLHMHLLAAPEQTTNLLLLNIGVGSLFLARGWLAAILTATGLGWTLIAAKAGLSGQWPHFGFALLATTVLAALLFAVRRATLVRLHLLHLRDVERAQELGEALLASEAARRSEEHSRGELEVALATLTSREGELQAARGRAEQALAAKSRFLSNMSHELRTPLNAVLGFSQVLRRGHPARLSDRDLTHLEKIEQGGRRLLALVESLLALTDDPPASGVRARSSIDVRDVIETVRAAHADAAADAGLQLDVEIPAEPVPHVIDPDALGTALNALVDNAIRFTDRGQVTIRLQPMATGQLTIDVVDTGPGIPADRLNSVFQPFHQVDETTARRHDGAGLGLAIARNLLVATGGEITVDSKPTGSTFRIQLARGASPLPLSSV